MRLCQILLNLIFSFAFVFSSLKDFAKDNFYFKSNFLVKILAQKLGAVIRRSVLYSFRKILPNGSEFHVKQGVTAKLNFQNLILKNLILVFLEYNINYLDILIFI